MTQLPYTVLTKSDILNPAKAWCEEQFGARQDITGRHGGSRYGSWTVFWVGLVDRITYYQWYFETEEQAILFKLSWGYATR